MPIPLPNLDDRRWADLVEEGQALIPLYAPDKWTNHNIHDPGITLMELFASVAEMDIYQLNRIPDRHRQKFLALIGLLPEPPHAARTVLSFTLQDGVYRVSLPSTVEFEGNDPYGQVTRFRTLEEITVVASKLSAVHVKERKGFQDLTANLSRNEPISLFGENPQPDTILYLGFTQQLPVDVPVSLFFTFTDLQDSEQERGRLIEESRARKEACCPAVSLINCEKGKPLSVKEEVEQTLHHHSVLTRWEFYIGANQWQPLDFDKGEIEDDTRSFTLNGYVRIKLPRSIMKQSSGARVEQLNEQLYYLRCRFIAGAYDAAPKAQNVVMNGVLAEQAAPVGRLTWTITEDAVVEGKEPSRGELTSFRLVFNSQEEIIRLKFGDEESPSFMLLEYQKPCYTAPGSLSIEAELLGYGTGAPHQQLILSEKPVQEFKCQLFTIEQGQWRVWHLCSDFDASDRTNFHFVLDPTEGIIIFGDGEKGRVVPLDVPIVASFFTTRAEAGNLAAGMINMLADTDSPHNHALLPDFSNVKDQLARIFNPIKATGGAAAETFPHAEGRAVELLEQPNRAVTLRDYEFFAMGTPGARLARVSAIANVHPAFPCYKAPGVITLVILPYLPINRPMPSQGLLRAVTNYIARHRVIGTRVVAVGPSYLELAVMAKVRARIGTDKVELARRITLALNRFFHPLKGGFDGKGWPFGRDIYRSEVLQALDEIENVDYVLSLELIANGGEPSCGNVCLGSTGLVAAGQHQIQVI